MKINTSVNFNEKGMYISYTSPFEKTARGTSIQKTKGVKKIKNSAGQVDYFRIDKIVEDMRTILESFDEYCSDYAGYISAKNKYDEIATNYIFEGSDFENKYNQGLIAKTMEKFVPLTETVVNEQNEEETKFLADLYMTMGESGGGKTTFLKQLIGSEETDFPATSQGNTTVGSLYVHYDKYAKAYKCCVSMFTKAQLLDRVKNATFRIVGKVLKNSEDILKIIYDTITVSSDRKCRLAYLVSKKDFEDTFTDDFLAGLEEYFETLWIEYLNSYSEIDAKLYEDYKEVTDAKVKAGFEVFLDDILTSGGNNSKHARLCMFYKKMADVILLKVNDVVKEFVEKILKTTKCSEEAKKNTFISILDENDSYTLSSEITSEELEKLFVNIYPKIIAVNIDASIEAIQFFRFMEVLSSANTKSASLYPLIGEMRLSGKFTPTWLREDLEIEANYILVDTEGFGHDMKEKDVPMALRKLLINARKIIFNQNGAHQINDRFANGLNALIGSSALEKTIFLFNRMELFDNKYDLEGKKQFVREGIENAIEKIVSDEKEGDRQFVRGNESLFTDIIEKNSFYIEYMDLRLDESDAVVPKHNLEKYQEYMNKANATKDTEMKELCLQMAEEYKIKFEENTNPVKILNGIIERMNQKEQDDFSISIIKPQYRADKFTNELNAIINEFLDEFTTRICGSPWQTVKAFNSRIAFDWDDREWKNLSPESLLIRKFQEHLLPYMIKPENVEALDKKALFLAINKLFEKKLNQDFMIFAKKLIYEDLKETCWKPMIEENGPGSTEVRKSTILVKLNKQFLDAENGNVLYLKMKDFIFGQKLLNNFKSQYL